MQTVCPKRDLAEEIKLAADFITKQLPHIKDCKVVMVLGSGLGPFTKNLENQKVLKYSTIPNWKESTVKGHSGQLVLGNLIGNADCFVMIMQGRLHSYEGYSYFDQTFPIRVFHELGIKNMIITNACGSVNPEYDVSDIMLISDHISFMAGNPLIGMPFKPQFVDMADAYSKSLRVQFKKIAAKKDIGVHEGVYVA